MSSLDLADQAFAGAKRANPTGVDNATQLIDRIQLGAVAGIDPGTRGTYTSMDSSPAGKHTSGLDGVDEKPVGRHANWLVRQN